MQLVKFFNFKKKLYLRNLIALGWAIVFLFSGYYLHHLSEPTIKSITSVSNLKNMTSFKANPGKFIADSQFQSNLNPSKTLDITFNLTVSNDQFSRIAKIQIIDGPVDFIQGLKVLKNDGKRYLVEVVDSKIIFKTILRSNDLISIDFFPTLYNPFNLLSHILLTIGLFILTTFILKSSFHRFSIFIFLIFMVSNFTTKHYLEFQNDTLGHVDAISNNKLLPIRYECEYCHHLPLGHLPYKFLFKDKKFYQNKDFDNLRFLSAGLFLIGFVLILKTLSHELTQLTKKLNHLYFLTFLFHPFFLFNNFQVSNDSVLYFFSFLTIYFLVRYKKINFLILLSGTLVKLNYIVLYPFIFFSSSNKKKTFYLMAISLAFLFAVNLYKDLPAIGVSDVFNHKMQTAKLNHTIKTFFDLPSLNELKTPFLTPESFDSTWIYLLKSSLFNELSTSRIDKLGHFIGINLLLAVALFSFFNILILLYPRKNLKKLITPNEILIISSIAAVVYAVLTLGLQSTQSFRNISFLLFPLFVFSAKLTSTNKKLYFITCFLLIYILVTEIFWGIYFVFSDIYNYF